MGRFIVAPTSLVLGSSHNKQGEAGGARVTARVVERWGGGTCGIGWIGGRTLVVLGSSFVATSASSSPAVKSSSIICAAARLFRNAAVSGSVMIASVYLEARERQNEGRRGATMEQGENEEGEGRERRR